MTQSVEVGGGLRRSHLFEALDGLPAIAGMSRVPRTSFGAADLQLVSESLRAAITLHGGRARTNNGVLRATLAAAAASDIDWLIAVAPERYKSGIQAEWIHGDLTDMAHSEGIRLDLAGVLVLSY